MAESQDLSAGVVSEAEAERVRRQAREEGQRQGWKTFVLWFFAGLILVLYSLFISFVFRLLLCPYRINHEQIFFAGLLAAVPTLLLINLFRAVSRPLYDTADDFESSHWAAIVKELMQAAISWLRSHR